MTLALGPEQQMLSEAVNSFLSALPPEESTWAILTTGSPPAAEARSRVWAAFTGQLGATGLPVPADLGGAGGSWRDVAVALENTGRQLAPLPYLEVMTAVRILELARSKEADALLAEIVGSGRCVVTVVPASAFAGDQPPVLRSDGGRVTGEVSAVLSGGDAEILLCPVISPGGSLSLVAVDAADAEVTLLPAVDLTRSLSTVRIAGAACRPVRAADPAAALADGLALAAAAVAAECTGGAGRCLELTVDYAKIRHQFGAVIGSYQAVKHTLADLARLIEPARSAVHAAFSAVEAGTGDTRVAASVARLAAVRAYAAAAGDAIQLHGAIGFTWEHELHLHFKRAVTCRSLFGSAAQHRGVLARELLGTAASRTRARTSLTRSAP